MKKKLAKKQTGGPTTAFQSYLKNVKGATPSDTTGGRNDTRGSFDNYSSMNKKGDALKKAYTATYGDGVADVDNRIPQNKSTVKAYTKSIKKSGGAVKSKKKK